MNIKKNEKLKKVNVNKTLNIIKSLVIHIAGLRNILIDREQKKIELHFRRKFYTFLNKILLLRKNYFYVIQISKRNF